ncbi:MAG: hypothetical protein HY901_22165, partial [Deltaproteobacteria bacterium]|nr:hypothetical protein [Deltaproteobacteria bacterium]
MASCLRIALALGCVALLSCGGDGPGREETSYGPEDCHNRVDDNGDGLVDCRDPVCASLCPSIFGNPCGKQVTDCEPDHQGSIVAVCLA